MRNINNADIEASLESSPMNMQLDASQEDKFVIKNDEQTREVEEEEEEEMLANPAHADLKPTTFAETFAHMIKGNIGCGILAMGAAYKYGGVLFSTVLIIAIGVISTYNQYILVCMANKFLRESKRHRMGFATTIEYAFTKGPRAFRKSARFVRYTVEMFIILTQLGFCCVYFMFASDSLDQIFKSYHFDIMEKLGITFMSVVLPIFWGTSLIRELKYIAPLSTLANMSIIASLGTILYCNIQELPSISTVKLIGNWNELPLCFGTVVYALEGISLVLPLQQNMKEKEKFLGPCGALNLSITIVVLLMINLGFFGYYKHGENVADSLTLNLDSNNIVTQIVIGSMVLGILCTYSLQFFIPVVLLLPLLRRHSKSWPGSQHHIYEYILRSALVFLTFFVAKTIPHFDLFISLIGAVGSSFLALIFTPLADIAIRKNNGILGWRVTMTSLSLLIGISGFLIGTKISLNRIIDVLQEDANLK